MKEEILELTLDDIETIDETGSQPEASQDAMGLVRYHLKQAGKHFRQAAANLLLGAESDVRSSDR